MSATSIAAGAALAASSGIIGYPLFLRRPYLTWGRRLKRSGKLPGDELLADAGLVSTRAVTPRARKW